MTRRRRPRNSGFTLIEVLVAMLLMAIVLPAIMKGMTLASNAGISAKHRTEAAGLAEFEMNDLIANGQYDNQTASGNFDDAPDYRWVMNTQNWPLDNTGEGLLEIDLQVFWTEPGHSESSVTVSTVIYPAAYTISTTTGTTTGTTTSGLN